MLMHLHYCKLLFKRVFASRTSEFSYVVSWGLPDGVRTGLRVAERHEAELAHKVELAAVVFGDLAAHFLGAWHGFELPLLPFLCPTK